MEIEEKIRQMLADTQKGLATKEDVKTSVHDAVKNYFEAQNSEGSSAINEAKKAIDELKAANDSLTNQVRQLMRSRFESIKAPDGMYNGIWGSLERAKNFGLYVIAEIARNQKAKETLESIGIERRFITGDGVQPTESQPGFKNIGLNARKMMTLTAIDSEVSEDLAIAVGEVVGRSIARAFAKVEDKIGFIGDGTSTYFNFVGAVQALYDVDATMSKVMGIRVQAAPGAWSAITRADILALPGMILDTADDGVNCKWYCHRNFYYTVMVDIALGLGGTNVVEAYQTGWTPTPRFLRRPVEVKNVMPRVKGAADPMPLLLANLKEGALLGDRRALQIDQSREAYFKTDQLGIRGTERIAVAVHGVGTSTDATDPQPGPIVGLQADIA